MIPLLASGLPQEGARDHLHRRRGGASSSASRLPAIAVDRCRYAGARPRSRPILGRGGDAGHRIASDYLLVTHFHTTVGGVPSSQRGSDRDIHRYVSRWGPIGLAIAHLAAYEPVPRTNRSCPAATGNSSAARRHRGHGRQHRGNALSEPLPAEACAKTRARAAENSSRGWTENPLDRA